MSELLRLLGLRPGGGDAFVRGMIHQELLQRGRAQDDERDDQHDKRQHHGKNHHLTKAGSRI